MRLFPAVPEDLTGLDVEALNALEAEFQSIARRIAANDSELLGDMSADAVIAEMTEGVAQLERIRSEIGGRAEAEQAFTEQVGELAAAFGVEADADETAEAPAETLAAADDDEDEAEAAAEPEAEASAEVEPVEAEAVVASAPVRLARPAAARASHRPRVVDADPDGPRPAALVASGYADGVVGRGSRLDRDALLAALGEGQRIMNLGQGKDRAIIASAQFQYPEDRLLGDNPARNAELIRAYAGVEGLEAIVASGGFCAPYPPLYDLPMISSAERPVRAALPGFGATRGGIQYPTPLGISDVIDGISVITAAQDEAGGTEGTKATVVIDCDEFQTAEVEAISAQVEHGNLNARAWPERVATVTQLLAAAHAQVAEGELLRQLSAGSTHLADGAVYGAFSSLVQGVLKAAAAYRSRHRMSPSTPLRAMYPAWVKDMLAADLAHGQFSRLEASARVGAVEQYLAAAGVNISWYIDQDGTTQQVYGTPVTDLDEFFTTVVWYLFHEGAWIFLDMGRLDLGIYRDADLISTNDYRMFYETFEGAAMVGVESLRIASVVCPNGATAAPATAFSC